MSVRAIYEFNVRIAMDHDPTLDFNAWAHHIKRRIEEGNDYDGVDVQYVKSKPLSSPDWPFEITDDQKSALWRKWQQDAQSLTFQEFVDNINMTSGMDGAITVLWCGMHLAIEKDGYTHS